MANWNEPTTISSYADFIDEQNGKIESAAKMDFSSDTNIPTGAIRWDSSTKKFQSWNGSSWVDLSVNFGNAVCIGTATSAGTGVSLRVQQSGDALLQIESTGGASYDQRIHFKDTASDWYVGNRYSGDANGFGIGRTGAKDDVQIDSSGQVGLGGAAAANHRLTVHGRLAVGSGNEDSEIAWREYDAANTCWLASVRSDIGGASDDLKFCRFISGTYQDIRLQISNSTGDIYLPNIGTGTGTTAIIDGSNRLFKQSSSARYKKDVETLESSYAEKVLDLHEVWYRSRSANDNPDWGWYGLIAEEVAEVDPRLVTWGYDENAYEHVDVPQFHRRHVVKRDDRGQVVLDESKNPVVETVVEPLLDERGNPVFAKDKRLKPDAQLVPEGVLYDRIAVLMLPVLRRHEATIKAQQGRIDALEARLAALEAKVNP